MEHCLGAGNRSHFYGVEDMIEIRAGPLSGSYFYMIKKNRRRKNNENH